MVYSQHDPPIKQIDMHIPGIDFIAREQKDMTYTTSIPSKVKVKNRSTVAQQFHWLPDTDRPTPVLWLETINMAFSSKSYGSKLWLFDQLFNFLCRPKAP